MPRSKGPHGPPNKARTLGRAWQGPGRAPPQPPPAFPLAAPPLCMLFSASHPWQLSNAHFPPLAFVYRFLSQKYHSPCALPQVLPSGIFLILQVLSLDFTSSRNSSLPCPSAQCLPYVPPRALVPAPPPPPALPVALTQRIKWLVCIPHWTIHPTRAGSP